MNIQAAQEVPFGYFFGVHCFEFSEEISGNTVRTIAKARSLFGQEDKVVPIAASVFKNPAIPKEVNVSQKNIIKWFLENDYTPQLRNKKKALGKKIVFISSSTISCSTALERKESISRMLCYCDQVIEHVHTLIVDLDDSSYNDWMCPISLQLFNDPVTDDHGHVFERNEIEKILHSENKCPLSREPIKSLTPNDKVKEEADRIRKLSPIPLPLSSQSQEPPKNVIAFRSLINKAIHPNDYQDVFLILEKAARDQCYIKDYELLPLFYISLNKNHHAALAYLQLAKKRIQEERFDEAERFLENGLELLPNNECILHLLARYLVMNDKPERAYQLFHKLASEGDRLTEKGKLAIHTYWEQALKCNPKCASLYYDIALDCYSDEQNFYLFLRGYINLRNINAVESEKFFLQAWNLHTNDLLFYIVYLDSINENHIDYTRTCNHIGVLFEQKEKFPQALMFYKMAMNEYNPLYIKDFISLLIKMEDFRSAKKVYVDWVSYKNQNPGRGDPSAKQIIKEAIATLGRKSSFLQPLYEIYSKENSPKCISLALELALLHKSPQSQ